MVLQARAAGNPFAEMMAVGLLVQIALQHGQSRFAFQVAGEAIDRIHDIVDGAPAARFLKRFSELLASGELLGCKPQPA